MRDLFTEVGLIFKSTPSRRGRQSTVRAFTCSSDLNPLPHAEGDVYVRSPPDGMENLNPLPHAEGDFADSVVAANDKIFKSTPSRRGRLDICKITDARCDLNPLPHAEGDC